MAIHVTPIPKLVNFATPAITIGATAAAGDAVTAIRSNSTIAGVALIASVNDTIARFNGTAGQLQGYTSNAPTISDAGVISLTSGQLTFPATANLSADANTLDDYEEGVFTPTMIDDAGNQAGYDSQLGFYTRIGNLVAINLSIGVNSFSGMTTANAAVIGGMPFTSANVAGNRHSFVVGFGYSLNISTSENMVADMNINKSTLSLQIWDTAAGTTPMTLDEVSSNAVIYLSGTYKV